MKQQTKLSALQKKLSSALRKNAQNGIAELSLNRYAILFKTSKSAIQRARDYLAKKGEIEILDGWENRTVNHEPQPRRVKILTQ